MLSALTQPDMLQSKKKPKNKKQHCDYLLVLKFFFFLFPDVKNSKVDVFCGDV